MAGPELIQRNPFWGGVGRIRVEVLAMVDFGPTTVLADIMLAHPACVVVFERHHIEFCCRGSVTLAAACRERGLEVEEVAADLHEHLALRAGPADAELRDALAMTIPELIEHIVDVHHVYLRAALQVVTQLSTKVARVHGLRSPSLVGLDARLHLLRATLEPHLAYEEDVVFPAILAATSDAPQLRATLERMKREDRDVHDELEVIRGLADDYRVPQWACPTVRGLFAEMERIEADVRQHVRLESIVLAACVSG